MSDVAIKGGGDADVPDSPKTDGTSYSSDSSVESFQPLTPSSPERHPCKAYGRRPVELMEPVRPSYRRSLAVNGNKMVYPARCRSIRVVPAVCIAEFAQIRDPRHVVRILDTSSYKLMLTDLDYNRMRKVSRIAAAPDRDAQRRPPLARISMTCSGSFRGDV